MAFQQTPRSRPVQTNRPTVTNNACGLALLNGVFLILLAIGGWYGWRSWSLVSAGGTVDGAVVGFDVSNDDDGDSYAPIIEYMVDDEIYQMNSSTYTSQPSYSVGQTVQILYDRTAPHLARINNFWELWLLPMIFVPLGLIFGLAVDLYVLYNHIQRARPR